MTLRTIARYVESLPSPQDTTDLLHLEMIVRQRRLREEDRIAHAMKEDSPCLTSAPHH